MNENIVIGLAAVIILGIASQWLAWRAHLPSILILLLTGFVAGPLTGWLQPSLFMGNLLFPFVSLAVAIILFEGGLSLHLQKLRGLEFSLLRLILVGALVTWALASGAVYYILEWDFKLSLLAGGILIVTGPTVVIPLLRYLRISGRVGAMARWEGIINDPIGATVAVLVFESLLNTGSQHTFLLVIAGVLKTLILGSLFGLGGGMLLILILKRYWAPDFLQSPLTLIIVLLVFVLTNHFQSEAGLLAVTLMGIVMANQKSVSLKGIIEFKENLQVLLISALFILLAARLQLSDFQALNMSSLWLLAALIFVVRPVAVFLSTFRTEITWKEKLLLTWMAPRGIVAAAVSAIFGLELVGRHIAHANELMPIVFVVIVGTVGFYGLTIKFVATRLKLAVPNPQGVMIIGAHSWARFIASALKDAGFSVLLADTNWHNVTQARQEGLTAYFGNVLSEEARNQLDLAAIGKLITLTPNREVNHLVFVHFMDLFEQADMYMLAEPNKPHASKKAISMEVGGRLLWGDEVSFDYLSMAFRKGAQLKTVLLTGNFNLDALKAKHNGQLLPLFLIDEKGTLFVWTTDINIEVETGQKIIAMVNADVQ